MRDVDLQRAYYAEAARTYHVDHVREGEISEHDVSLQQLVGYARLYAFQSLLDVGSGTGRVVEFMGKNAPDIAAVGIEPVAELREIGHQRGIAPDALIDGNATRMAYPDQSFDVVTAFGMLHHVPDPSQVIAEMLRVARKAIFISDGNCFGQGRPVARLVKAGLRVAGLWRASNWLRTGGKGYHISEGDGLFYSYSPFQNYPQIESATSTIIISSTRGKARNLVTDAETVSILGLKG